MTKTPTRWEFRAIHGPEISDPERVDVIPVGVQLAQWGADGWEPWALERRATEVWIWVKRPIPTWTPPRARVAAPDGPKAKKAAPSRKSRPAKPRGRQR